MWGVGCGLGWGFVTESHLFKVISEKVENGHFWGLRTYWLNEEFLNS